MKFTKTFEKVYQGLEGDVVSTSYVYDNGVAIEVVPVDFEVKIKEEVVLPHFKGEHVDIEKEVLEFVRPATDGVSYIDARYAKSKGLHKAVQFRFTPVGKGMLVPIPGLKKLLGSDMILFDGAVKADIGIYLKKSELDFYVLNEAREVEENESLLLSRQVFGAIALTCPAILDGLQKETKEVLEKAYDFDKEALQEFVGIHHEETEDGEAILDVDNLTVELFTANPDKFLQDDNNKKKLASLIKSSTGELERGAKMYVKDASIKHMVVDPFTVVGFMAQNVIGVDASTVEQRGIRRRQFITTGIANGYYYVEHEKAFLARYPFLHYLEGQLVNNDGGSPFLDQKTADLYQRFMSKGFFQGLGIYSLWDMVPEGQSGADFDGDTTVYTTNPMITENFPEQPLFLDYSKVDGEVVEGVPWKGSGKTIEREDVLTHDYGVNDQVDFDNGTFTFPEALKGDTRLEKTMADAMAKIGGLTNAESYIGLFTNINSSIMELELSMKRVIEQIEVTSKDALVAREILKREAQGYKKLSILMACAIRWEIDKAKHGGAFMEKLPFLTLFVDGIDNNDEGIKEVRQIEQAFGVSLERLFWGERKEVSLTMEEKAQRAEALTK